MKNLFVACAVAFAAAVFALPAAAQSPSHLAAAETVLELSNAKEQLEASFVEEIAKLKDDPETAGVVPVMERFFATYITWDKVKPRLAAIYAKHFTEAELRELAAFYRTPIGRKFAERAPAVAVEGGRMGHQLVMENQDALEAMIIDYLAQQSR